MENLQKRNTVNAALGVRQGRGDSKRGKPTAIYSRSIYGNGAHVGRSARACCFMDKQGKPTENLFQKITSATGENRTRD